MLTTTNTLLHNVNVPRGRHPIGELEAAVRTLEAARWNFTEAKGRGHAKFVGRCPHGCCQHSVWSTPRVPENHARQIVGWLRHCPGEQGESR